VPSQKSPSELPDNFRDLLLDAAVLHVPFEGWSMKALHYGADDLNVSHDICDIYFKGGANELIDSYAKYCDEQMAIAAQKIDLTTLKIRDKIIFLVRSRLESESQHIEAARRGISFLALPCNHSLALSILYRTVDKMWRLTNDPSTDYNFYTKRMTLSAVYSSVFLFWINDDSENFNDTWKFLDRRIENIMQFEKAKAKIIRSASKIPDISKIFRPCRSI
jgi:ubiquinone biosynthesis protein COQ9